MKKHIGSFPGRHCRGQRGKDRFRHICHLRER